MVPGTLSEVKACTSSGIYCFVLQLARGSDRSPMISPGIFAKLITSMTSLFLGIQ
jgi:hypothetical protein